MLVMMLGPDMRLHGLCSNDSAISSAMHPALSFFENGTKFLD